MCTAIRAARLLMFNCRSSGEWRFSKSATREKEFPRQSWKNQVKTGWELSEWGSAA